MRTEGVSWRKIAMELGMPVATVVGGVPVRWFAEHSRHSGATEPDAESASASLRRTAFRLKAILRKKGVQSGKIDSWVRHC